MITSSPNNMTTSIYDDETKFLISCSPVGDNTPASLCRTVAIDNSENDPLIVGDDSHAALLDSIRALLEGREGAGKFYDGENKDGGFLVSESVMNVETDNLDPSNQLNMQSDLDFLDSGLLLYAYVTPCLMVLGILGNTVSLRVFLSRRMTKMSASLYLACIAASDTAVILTYILVDWLSRGLPRLTNLNNDILPQWTNATCSLYLFASYISRFASVWCVVAFTVERYIVICSPLGGSSRRGGVGAVHSSQTAPRRGWKRWGPGGALTRRQFAIRSLALVFIASFLCCLYKPFLVGVRKGRGGSQICSYRPGYELSSFVLDTVYGCSITVLPFVIMFTLNVLICRRLRYSKMSYVGQRLVTEESKIKMEFTIILLVVSFTFILLNTPYLITWSYNSIHRLQDMRSVQLSRDSEEPLTSATLLGRLASPTETERQRGMIQITKTLFVATYCIKFLIYCLLGTYFRCQLLRHVTCIGSSDRRNSSSSRVGSLRRGIGRDVEKDGLDKERGGSTERRCDIRWCTGLKSGRGIELKSSSGD